MSTRDSKYDYIRVRPRKDKDKDSDKRSSIAGTGGLIVKKHRDSTTSRSVAPSDSASQTCTETQSQMSNDASSPDLPSTPSALRNPPSVPLNSCPPLSSIQTPAALQPYLESEAGAPATLASHGMSMSTNEAKKEWVGPVDEIEKAYDDFENSVTPKPMRRAPSETKGRAPDARSSISLVGKLMILHLWES